MGLIQKTAKQVFINSVLVKLHGDGSSVIKGGPKTTTNTALDGPNISAFVFISFNELASKIVLPLANVTPMQELIEDAISKPAENTIVIQYANGESEEFVSCSVDEPPEIKQDGSAIEVKFSGVEEKKASSDTK